MKRLAAIGCLLAAAHGHAQVYGSWTVENMTDERAIYAATINESGGLLGKTCSADGCQWILTNTVNCQADAKYPALLNGDSGAWHVTLVCSPNTKVASRYTILEYESVDSAVASGESVGVAMPMQSGQFRVSRYAIKGWGAASQRLRERALQMLKKPGESSL